MQSLVHDIVRGRFGSKDATRAVSIWAVVGFSVMFGSCVATQDVRFGTNLGTTNTFNGTFEIPPGGLNPTPAADLPDGNVHLDPSFTYWLAAGDQVSASWSDYSVNWPCLNDPPNNLCLPAFRGALPSADCSNLAISLPRSCRASGGCPRVWLFQGQSLDSSSRTVFSALPKSVADGCSPSTVSFAQAQDATLALWASERTDIPQNYPADTLGDKIGSTLNVNLVQPGMPRVVVRRRPLTQICGPSTASFPQSHPCSNNPSDDQTESHWAIDTTQFSLKEGFSAGLRVKEARVFTANESDTTAAGVAFCWVQASQPNSRVGSDCDASMGPQMGDCKAPLSAVLTPASPGWTVAFSDASRPGPGATTLPSKCPNDPNRATVWLEFTLEKRQ